MLQWESPPSGRKRATRLLMSWLEEELTCMRPQVLLNKAVVAIEARMLEAGRWMREVTGPPFFPRVTGSADGLQHDDWTRMRLKRPRARLPLVRGAAEGGHAWTWPSAGWKCGQCGATTGCRRDRVRQRCDAGKRGVALALAWRAGHLLMASGSVTWCSRCGKYACPVMRGLSKPCGHRPAHGSKQWQWLRLLRNGRHPVSRASLGGRPLALVAPTLRRGGAPSA